MSILQLVLGALLCCSFIVHICAMGNHPYYRKRSTTANPSVTKLNLDLLKGNIYGSETSTTAKPIAKKKLNLNLLKGNRYGSKTSTTAKPVAKKKLNLNLLNGNRYGSTTSTTAKPVAKKIFYDLSKINRDQCGFSEPRGLDTLVSNFYDDTHTNLGEFTWMLSIYRNKSYIGSATLLQADVVLTAATLIVGIPTNELLIVAGEWDKNSQPDGFPLLSRTVSDTAINESLAILYLNLPYDTNAKLQAGLICLPIAETVFEWEVCKTTAWRMPSVKSENASNILQKQDYRIMSQQDCGSQLPPSYVNSETGILDSKYLCAMDEMNNDSCMINGGAALFCPLDASAEPRYVQAGIALMGTNCGKTKSPALFISITHYMHWIELKLSSDPSFKARKQLKKSKELREPIKPVVSPNRIRIFRTSAYSIRYADNIQKPEFLNDFKYK